MLKDKPVRRPRQRLDELPTYTIPEAAQTLAIPTRTMFDWYGGRAPVLIPSATIGAMRLLSYRDLEEAYRVHLLRTKYGFALQYLRRAMTYARQKFRTPHPLRRADAIKECMSDLVYQKQSRGRHPREIVSIGSHPGQTVFAEVADLFSQRIVAGEFIFPWRYAAKDSQTRPVSVNPNIMSGRLVVVGTRIPVSTLAGMRRSGRDATDIASEYGLNAETVRQALTHFQLRQKAA